MYVMLGTPKYEQKIPDPPAIEINPLELENNLILARMLQPGKSLRFAGNEAQAILKHDRNTVLSFCISGPGEGRQIFHRAREVFGFKGSEAAGKINFFGLVHRV